MAVGFNGVKRIAPKLNINVGATIDIPTGPVITGARGESIVNGGLGSANGIVAPGNTFKSMITSYIMCSAANRISASYETFMHTYDTEVNIQLDRLNDFARRFEYLNPDPVYSEEGYWSVTDKSQMPGEEWAISMFDYMTERAKNAAKNEVEWTAFKDPYTKKPLRATVPDFITLDSLTEFEGSSTIDMLEKQKADDNSTNMVFLKQGLAKTKLLKRLPYTSNRSNTRFLITAHIGKEIDMATGPAAYNKPSKELQYLKGGDKIKGVSSSFFFLTSTAWQAHPARVLKNQTTKMAEYPRGGIETEATDLNIVRITQLRSKSGMSGYTLNLVISQTEGILPSLTEFENIKSNNRFGIGGTAQWMELDLMPGVKVSRTTIRHRLDNDAKFARAVQITSDILQHKTFHPHLVEDGLWCDAKTLYKDLTEMGYDWDELLTTRNWYTIDQYSTALPPFLSAVDLFKMRKGMYTPYWKDNNVYYKAKVAFEENAKKSTAVVENPKTIVATPRVATTPKKTTAVKAA